MSDLVLDILSLIVSLILFAGLFVVLLYCVKIAAKESKAKYEMYNAISWFCKSNSPKHWFEKLCEEAVDETIKQFHASNNKEVK